jgi:transcriptional regulator with AAA-type ATPase domain/tetratricopeptide (TPR) repeat protein
LTSPADEQTQTLAPCAPDGAGRESARASSSRAAVAALRRSDHLCSAGRPDEALAAVMRPLGRPPRDPELLARLRIARGTASWLAGPPGPARVHIHKALRRAGGGLTRARALEACARMLSADQRWDEARALLAEAIPLYRAAAHPALCDALQLLAQTARDAGDLAAAIATQGAAVASAREAGAGHRISETLTYRATLLSLAGRLADARSDLELAQPSGEAPAPLRTRWSGARAMLELTEGDLPAARAALVDAEAGIAEGVDPRTRAEVLLLLSDLCLADGEHAAAEVEAARALAEFRAVGDTAGESRSRVRRAHALLGAGRRDEALREARRALKATGARGDLRTLALVTLGRIQLRSNVDDARASFAAAAEQEPAASSLGVAARIGHAVACGASAAAPEVQAALRLLEERGDRRILSYCLAELRVLHGGEPADAPIAPSCVDADPLVGCLVTAAEALAGDASLGERVATALAAVRPALSWWRAAIVGASSFGLRADRSQPAPLRPDELAVRLAARGGGPAVVDLRASEVWRRDPECALHGLALAWLVPAGPSRVLYVDTRDPSAASGERALDLLVQLGRLLAPHLAAPLDDPGTDDPPALPGIVGRSAPMEAMVREVVRAAAGTGVVHVFGETGTGKERVAHAVHLRSARSQGPWVPVNASSVSDELFESEMFGHVRGAFSGAVADRRGYVSEAEGGTLFLDEVTDLSPKAQAKLLRFVQDREYRRVGDPRLHRANVRLVTAANVPLEACVRRGAFREDLMYRLCQETIVLPPLRERGDDVARLARHFLRAGSPGPAPAVTPAVWGLLARHHWPGNVRELESEMARALARAAGGTVRPEHLSVGLQRAPRAPLRPLRQALAEFEREHVARALEQNGGNRALTAAHLGLSRQALLAKINRLGIVPGLR